MKKLSFLFISLLTAFAFTGCTDGLDNIEYNPSNGVILSAPVSASATDKSVKVEIIQATSVSGTAIVKFDYKGVVKTYKVVFTPLA